MGKATRWLRSLLGMKKDKENVDTCSNLSDRKDKRRWSFAKSENDSSGQIRAKNNNNNAWMRSYISDTDKEQNKHAIALAAASAAAADAAVVAAQAAVAVVRLTSQGRGTLFAGSREKWAAVKIQAVFRGFLSRKALRALRGLVKLQALVRGYLVRKRAAATLHSMQALIRAQTAVRSERARRSFTKDHQHLPETRLRKCIQRFEETRSEVHSKRFSSAYETTFYPYDETPKIIEIDTFKRKSRSRRMDISPSDLGEDHPFTCPVPSRVTIPSHQQISDYEWTFMGDEYKFATAQSTPRFANSGRSNAPATPAKSVCGDSFFRPYSNYPSYMANTQSFRAKLRSHSAPKQRPESASKKRLSLNEIMASRTSFSSVKMQRPAA